MQDSKTTLEHGLSLMIFPEGTRSRGGELLPFKDGAFSLAIEKGAPILPVVIHGTRDCIPKGSPWFGAARAHARVLEPVSTEGLSDDDVRDLKERVRQRMIEAQSALKAELEDAVRSATA